MADKSKTKIPNEVQSIQNGSLQPFKMRIQLYDPKSGALVSDRLVAQLVELVKGPSEVHSGPVTIEMNFHNQSEANLLIDYIKRLKGDLPISETTKKVISKNKTIDKMLSDKEPLVDLIKTLKAKAKTQEDYIKMLREYEFKFVMADTIQDMIEFNAKVGEQIKLRERDIKDGYQFMVRLIKEAKEPMNDSYDFRLLFGIKLIGERVDKIVIYLWGEFNDYVKKPWKDKLDINFKKVEKLYQFPEFMDYADRRKWRTEHRKKQAAEEKGEKFETSKFYNKYSGYVKGL